LTHKVARVVWVKNVPIVILHELMRWDLKIRKNKLEEY
jgi:hypothetical protein